MSPTPWRGQEVEVDARARAVWVFISDGGGASREDLARVFERERGWSRRMVTAAITELRNANLIEEPARGRFVAAVEHRSGRRSAR
jgi:alkaline phosphatase